MQINLYEYLAIFIFCAVLIIRSVFLSYLWLWTTTIKYNDDFYKEQFSLLYGLQFEYIDFNLWGINVLDKDEMNILS